MSKTSIVAALCAVVLGSLVGGQAVLAETLTYSGTGTSCVGTCTGPAFGTLSLPLNLTFNDNLGMNSSGGTETFTDDWTFTIPAAAVSGTVSGDQIDLSNFSFSGTVDSFSLFALGAGGPTKIASGTLLNPFSQVILDPSVSSGNYDLQIVSHLNVGSIGSYSGVLVAASPVPLPASAWLLFCGAGGVLTTMRRRKLS